ncbi:hypothetical protein [Agrilutibacter solisilvae]|uniref:Uncharacterized protein n=1 Tax=Agrilutibacter solisilvae TaxID=2763317 RepID=A0A975ATW5_9GAMM|nr:hypothetical protein [Lysobacter solisilvae]QSX79569.1 hypothetical protein I8J32_006885 [Lysobacter solisilvae]
MPKFLVTAVLLAALFLPVALFWLLISHSALDIRVAAAVSVAAGWLLNLAWASAVTRVAPVDPAQPQGDTFTIAARFGWVCPSVLVLLTWLAWRFTSGGAG